MAETKTTQKKTTTAGKSTTTKSTAVKKPSTTKKVAAEKVEAPKKVASTQKVSEAKVEKTQAVEKKSSAPKKVETKTAKKVSAKKTIRVTLIKSYIGYKSDQARTVRALGLNKLNSTNELVDNPCIRGMIFKVKHLIRVEEMN